MPLIRLCLLALSLALLPLPALAWGQLGHRLVGELAERHLSPTAEQQVRELLADEADPTLAGVANWADTLRNDDPERFRKTSTWHYVGYPDGTCIYNAASSCPNGNCVVAAIQAQQRILADRSQTREARRDALKFLVHFIGDIHQPFHANNHDDKGGNEFQISLRTDLEPEAYARARYVDGVMGTNLHSVWDFYILASANDGKQAPTLKPYVDQLDALSWPPRLPGDIATGPSAWAGESCRLVNARHLYPPSHILDRRYLDAQRPLAEQRIRQAAYRLALLLDIALGTKPR